MADAFFSNIIACVQMLDTRLVIRMAVSDAQERLLEYVGRWPLLGKTCALFLDDAVVELLSGNGTGGRNSVIHLDPEITDVPLVKIRFHERDGELSPARPLEEMESGDNISWFAVADAALGRAELSSCTAVKGVSETEIWYSFLKVTVIIII